MSLMEESANAELQGKSGGAHRCTQSAAGNGREDHGRTGGGSATRGPGSTSTHLNFGPSQGQCSRTIRPLLSYPSVTSLSLVSSYSCARVPPFLFPPWPPRFPFHPQKGPYRAIVSYRAKIHTHSMPPYAVLLFSLREIKVRS